jgi:hypothetical protein
MEIYILSIVSAFLGYFSSRFANLKLKGILPTIGLLFLLAFTAAGLTFVGHWIMKPPPLPPNGLEGQWVERYLEGENATYSIATIRHNPEGNYLEYSGKAYDSNLNVVGHWHAIQARLDRNQYDYLFEGESFNPDKARQGTRKGVGGIFFDGPNHGKGKFLSVRDDHDPRDCELDRILNEDAVRESLNDPQGFIQKLYSDPMYFKQVTSAR